MVRQALKTVTRKNGFSFTLFRFNRRWFKIPRPNVEEIQRSLAARALEEERQSNRAQFSAA